MKKEKLNTTAINHMRLTISIRLLFTLYGLGIATLPAFADISECTLSDLSAQKKCIANYSLPDGSKFLGLIENGKKNGKGEELFTNGDRYVGNYVDDAPTGVGIHLMSNGGRYLGQLKDGNYHGKGVLITPDGKIEKEGVWSDDKFVKSQPIGIDPRFDYVKNYDTLVSLLSEDAPTATNLPLPPCVGPTQNWKRCWVKVDQTAWPKYEGEIRDGRKYGKGTHYNINGNILVGTMVDNVLEGEGILFDVSGLTHVGNFKDGYPHGPGVRFNGTEGRRSEGIWERGKLIKEQATGIGTNVQRPENAKDFYGNTINFSQAVWVAKDLAHIGTATKTGNVLGTLLNDIETLHNNITSYMADLDIALKFSKNTAQIKASSDKQIKAMMEQQRLIDRFVELWSQAPLEFRKSFGKYDGAIWPTIDITGHRPNISVIVDREGKLLRIFGSDHNTTALAPITLYPRKK